MARGNRGNKAKTRQYFYYVITPSIRDIAWERGMAMFDFLGSLKLRDRIIWDGRTDTLANDIKKAKLLRSG